jgi:hypothetical protein
MNHVPEDVQRLRCNE